MLKIPKRQNLNRIQFRFGKTFLKCYINILKKPSPLGPLIQTIHSFFKFYYSLKLAEDSWLTFGSLVHVLISLTNAKYNLADLVRVIKMNLVYL